MALTKLRVLIIDSEEPVRRFLRRELGRDPVLSVVGTAHDGASAIAQVRQLRPDVVTLDMGMPGVNGLELLIQLKALRPQLRVVMFSGLGLEMQSLDLDKLGADAMDEKRAAAYGDLVRHVQDHLVARIKAQPRRPSVSQPSTPSVPYEALSYVAAPSENSASKASIQVLAIGSSAGGPEALAAFLAMLPADLPVPVVIAQHMPANFTRILAERLSSRCALEVCEASAGDVLCAGRVLVAPGDHHMRVVRKFGRVVIALDQGPKVQSVRPAVDVLFQSVAEAYPGCCLAVVLTGMGRDGAEGCEHVRKHGGQVIVQDEATSLVWGMPGAVANAGLAQAILPLQKLPSEALRRIARGRARPSLREDTTTRA